MNEKVFVAGRAGFICTHVVGKLASQFGGGRRARSRVSLETSSPFHLNGYYLFNGR